MPAAAAPIAGVTMIVLPVPAAAAATAAAAAAFGCGVVAAGPEVG